MRQILILFIFIIPFLGCEKDEDKLDVQASFEYTILKDTMNQIEVKFQNCSKNAKKFYWDFNDGTESIEKDPIHKFSADSLYSVKLIAFTGSNSDTLVRVIGQIVEQIEVYKPNIYIYPQKTINLCLNISFPFGGKITESIPVYNQGGGVSVDSSSRIDNKYDFLFYESLQPDKFQYKQGWCIAQSDLKSFFIRNMSLYNFSDNEIKDFLEYWIPKLILNKYYKIYPQISFLITSEK